MIAVSIITGIVYLIVAIAVCFKFADIAEMKGHNKTTHFWWCFWCGIFGMLAVIALPDRRTMRPIAQPGAKSQPAPSDELPDL